MRIQRICPTRRPSQGTRVGRWPYGSWRQPLLTPSCHCASSVHLLWRQQAWRHCHAAPAAQCGDQAEAEARLGRVTKHVKYWHTHVYSSCNSFVSEAGGLTSKHHTGCATHACRAPTDIIYAREQHLIGWETADLQLHQHELRLLDDAVYSGRLDTYWAPQEHHARARAASGRLGDGRRAAVQARAAAAGRAGAARCGDGGRAPGARPAACRACARAERLVALSTPALL